MWHNMDMKLSEYLRFTAFTLLECCKHDDQWWFGIAGFEWRGEDTGHLFYIENDQGYWKFDLFWIRPFYYSWKLGLDK